jgi:hypothetical protein
MTKIDYIKSTKYLKDQMYLMEEMLSTITESYIKDLADEANLHENDIVIYDGIKCWISGFRLPKYGEPILKIHLNKVTSVGNLGKVCITDSYGVTVNEVLPYIEPVKAT